MNRQETIDATIISRKGKWFARADMEFANDLKIKDFKLTAASVAMVSISDYAIGYKEFYERAKEMGYINGFQWGVEYPTNGVKPDLPGDLMISPFAFGSFLTAESIDEIWNNKTASQLVSKFKITDERYKPIEPAQPVAHWYDYDLQKAVALPPVGESFEIYFEMDDAPRWEVATTAYLSDSHLILSFAGGTENHYDAIDVFGYAEMRPLDWNRKAEQECSELIEKAKSVCFAPNSQPTILTIKHLIDAGWRPTK